MYKRVVALLMVLCLACAVLPAAAAAEIPVTVTCFGTHDYDEAREVVRLVNSERAGKGLDPLSHNETLCALAMQRAAELAFRFSHNRPSGPRCDSIFEGAYEGWTTWGENVAAGQSNAAEAMDSWMGSDGHRANILTADFTQIGVGCFESNGIRTWVQMFGNSTTNTAVTQRTGAVTGETGVSVLPSLLDIRPSGSESVPMEIGQTRQLRFWHQEPQGPRPILCPEIRDVTDADGRVVAEVRMDAQKNITVEAVASGTGTVSFPVYDGQKDAYRLTVTVPEAPTQPPTEPPTQPPTEPPTVPPTEPPTQPPTVPPTEPPTEPEPTDPAGPQPQDYRVELACSGHGSACLDRDRAEAGAPVRLQVFPDPEYFYTVSFTSHGSPVSVELTEEASDRFTFRMPACDVELSVDFRYWHDHPFVDIHPDDYFYDPVLWAYHSDITSGIDATHFGPGRTCTRAQVVTFLWSAFGRPQPQSLHNPFADVGPDDYYYHAVLWAVENGITSGLDAARFGPDHPCTRAQVVTFLWSAAGRPDLPECGDIGLDVHPGDYFYDAVIWALDCGITAGMDDWHFGPHHPCTRGQIATFLCRAFVG